MTIISTGLVDLEIGAASAAFEDVTITAETPAGSICDKINVTVFETDFIDPVHTCFGDPATTFLPP